MCFRGIVDHFKGADVGLSRVEAVGLSLGRVMVEDRDNGGDVSPFALFRFAAGCERAAAEVFGEPVTLPAPDGSCHCREAVVPEILDRLLEVDEAGNPGYVAAGSYALARAVCG